MDIVKAPDNRLRIKTKPVKKVTPELLRIMDEMIKLTKTFIDPEGVGLAATQIGQDQQYFVAKVDNEADDEKEGNKQEEIFIPVFNPEIISSGKTTKVFFEGCLSIPDYYGEVRRPTQIEVKYIDKSGQPVRKKLSGVDAWIFQHEYDHLQGKLFVDRVLEQKSRLFKVSGKDRSGAEVFEEINLSI